MAAQSFANFAPDDLDQDKNDPTSFAMGVPTKPDEFGGSGGMATSAVAANGADASPELKAAARLQQTHGAPAADPSRGLMDKPRTAVPGPPTMARTAEEAVASGTVVPGKIETESVTTTIKSPETTRKVESEEGKGARRDLEFQKKRIVEATETQMDAEANIDRIALDAEAKRNDLQRQYNEEEDRKRQAIEDDRIAREKAADKELEDADVKVKTAQDAAINWKQARTPLRILQAVLRAASIPDAVRMNPNANPLDNPVARTIDASLEDEKKRAHDKFLASKEWRDALKTKNAELIKRTYDRETAKLNMEVTARARNLLMSEKADQLAQRTAKLDPNGDAYRSSKDLALAKLAADDARDRAAYAQAYDPTVTSGGKITTTVKKTTEGSNAKPLDMASPAEIDKQQMAKNDVAFMRRLADKLEANPESWENLQAAEKSTARQEGIRKGIPFLGPIGVSVGTGISSALGVGGPTVEDKLLGNNDKTGAEMSGQLNEYIAKSAKALDPQSIVRAEELVQRREQLGVSTLDAKAMAAKIRADADNIERRQKSYESVKRFPDASK